MKILIVGFGVVGTHIYKEFEQLSPIIYDPYKGYNNYIDDADFAFICVPTDSNEDGSCNISIVESAVKRCCSKIIVIKSAIPVGTAETLEKRYNKRIVVSPEYYGATNHSLNDSNFVILGGNQEDTSKVAQLYYKVKKNDFRVVFTSHRAAELVKYMENCFLALKVTFCSEFAEIAKEYGIPYEQLRELFILDKRVGDSHTFVYNDKPYYDSHCLNKDIPALIQQSNGKAKLMKAVYDINTSIRGEINDKNR